MLDILLHAVHCARVCIDTISTRLIYGMHLDEHKSSPSLYIAAKEAVSHPSPFGLVRPTHDNHQLRLPWWTHKLLPQTIALVHEVIRIARCCRISDTRKFSVFA
jgi:hypothetical protein